MLKSCRSRNVRRVRRDAARISFFVPVLLALVLAAGVHSDGRAQSLGGDNSMLLDLAQQRMNGSDTSTGIGTSALGSADSTNSDSSGVVLWPYYQQNTTPLPASRLEQIMSARAGAKLQQFGYEQFGRGQPVQVPQTGAVQDDYILGPGDVVTVTLRGQENSQLRTVVDRNGQAILQRLPPLSAMGRTLADFRTDVETQVHRAYVATNAFVSISRVRQISVLVSGEVNSPGLRSVTGLSSVADAILLSGGVRKTGSLRNIRLVRGEHTYTVDLYSLLTGGGAMSSMHLADGDRIVVPPLGRTVAVSGLVRLPGIFEMPAGQSQIAVRSLLALAGGQEIRGLYRLSALQIDAEGRSNMNALSGDNSVLGDSEILFVQLGADQTARQATLSGGTGLAGAYPITQSTTLSEILRQPGAMGDSPYTLFGIIVRKDPRSLLRTLVPFTPVAVLNNAENEQLQTDDVIRVLSVGEASLLGNVVRAYLEKLAGDQAVLRNPLIDQNASSVMPALPVAGTSPQSAASAALLANGAVPVPVPTASVSVLPVSKTDELSFALYDLTSAPPDVQRADILSLMDMRAPGTLATGSAEAMAEQTDQAGEYQDPAAALALSRGTPPPNSDGAQMGGQSAAPQGFTPPRNDAVAVARQGAQNYQERPVATGGFVSNREIKTFGELVRQLNVDPLVLINFLMENRARLDGAVRGPGSYFVGPNVELADLVQAAGGTVNWADDSGVDLVTTAVDHGTGQAITRHQNLPLRQSSLVSYMVRPRDTLHFNQVFTDVGIGAATVQGEVRAAGAYPITRGEHLSELLARAGGLTNTAYPAGTVFLRKSAAAAEHDGYIRAANEIENQLVNAMTRIGNDKIDPSAFASLQAFVNELRNQKAVGRISIVADPSVLAAKPEQDPLLESGDLVYIPQWPSTISVLGQVSQPGSFPYQPGRSLEDYIQLAGGYAALSDPSMAFIVLPDGSARKVEKSWLTFDTADLPPGSTIVVPRDVTPLDTRQLILDVSSIFSQFAVSIASMAVLAKQ